MKPNSEDMNGSVEDIGVELTEKIYAATTTPILGPQTNSTEPNEDDWEDYIPEPPDGGWGWVVMVASFVNNFVLDGIAYCFGVFLLEYVKFFNSSIASASLANSLLCGVYLLVGPIVGALVNKFGCRPVGIAGSIIGACAFLLSTVSKSVVVFQLTYGVIGGFGFGMMYLPAVVGVGYYFEKKRGIATGIAVCGTGIGVFCMAPFGKFLLHNVDWKGAHIALAGLLLQGCISSALMRPLTPKRRRRQPKGNAEKTNGHAAVPCSDDQKALLENGAAPTQPNAENSRRNRTMSSTSYIAGSRLVVVDSGTPADNIHASAFLHTPANASGAVSPHVSVQNLSRPLYRKDIFYSGSVLNVSHVKSKMSLKSYVASIATLPSAHEQSSRLSCLNSLPKPMADILAEMLDLTVLRNKGMMVLCAANVVGMIGYYVPFIFSSSRAVSLGVSEGNAALLLSLMGICNTVGRVLSGVLSTIPGVSALLINNICVTLCGISVLLIPFCNSFALMVVANSAFGLFASTLISLAPIIMCELVGLEKLTNGFGLLCLVRGVTAIAGPPIVGMLYDITGDYSATFYAGGACLIACGALHFLLHLKYFKGKTD